MLTGQITEFKPNELTVVTDYKINLAVHPAGVCYLVEFRRVEGKFVIPFELFLLMVNEAMLLHEALPEHEKKHYQAEVTRVTQEKYPNG